MDLDSYIILEFTEVHCIEKSSSYVYSDDKVSFQKISFESKRYLLKEERYEQLKSWNFNYW